MSDTKLFFIIILCGNQNNSNRKPQLYTHPGSNGTKVMELGGTQGSEQ